MSTLNEPIRSRYSIAPTYPARSHFQRTLSREMWSLCNMWSQGLDLRSIKLTVVKVFVSSEGTCNNCLFVEVFNYFLKCSNEIFHFLTSNS